MKRSVPAFLRNQFSILDLLEENKSVASVRLGGKELGTWEGLRPKWWLAGERINLHLSVLGCRGAYFLKAVRRITGGVRLQLSRTAHRSPQSMEVYFMENTAEGCVPQPEVRLLLASWIQLEFPGSQVITCAQRSDLANSLSGAFVRAYFRHRGRGFLALACDIYNSSCDPEDGLAQALIWLCRLRRGQLTLGTAPTIHILTPINGSAALCHRAMRLNPKKVKVRAWEFEPGTSSSWTAKKAPRPSLPMENRDYRWPALGSFRWSPLLLRVLQLAPGSIRRYPRFLEYDSLKLEGLEFARVFGPQRERICFGVGSQKKELTDECFPDLIDLVDEILFYRRPDSPNTHHPYYCAQSERWLESLILDRAPDLFPELAPECIYSQIPVYLGKDPGRVDILGANERGCLIVMELKVDPDPDLPLQALDYWARVLRHNRDGDFERRGYFPGIRLTRSCPKIYLVAPIFSYHDTTEQILRYFDPKIEVWKISVNEDWRCGLKILRRDCVNNCGNL